MEDIKFNPQDYQIIQSHGKGADILMPVNHLTSEQAVLDEARSYARRAYLTCITAHYRVFGPKGYITSYVVIGQPTMYEHTDVSIPSVLKDLK
jgi:hypothetical protein